MSEPHFVEFAGGGWRGRVLASWRELLGDEDPLAWARRQAHEVVRERVSRQVIRVQSPRGVVYLKILRGLNDVAMRRPTWLGRLKWRCRPSRAMQTLRVSGAMLAAGLCCPMPVLAARQDGAQGVDLFISEALEWPSLRQRLRAEPEQAQRARMLRTVAPQIARFHQLRFLHGDLLPHNLGVTDSLDQVAYMDNDRTRRWPMALPMPILRRNLCQFAFRLMREGDGLPEVFLESYAQAAGWSAATAQRQRARVLRAIERRWREAGRDQGD